MTVHVVPSAARLSPFRVNRLIDRLRTQGATVNSLIVQDFYLVQGEADKDDLNRLLGGGSLSLREGEGRLFVVPRLGTVSPWSSKATDIARVCGLTGVRRIELGRLVVPNGGHIPAKAWNALHDPMMETVLEDLADLDRVFDTQATRPLRRVPVLAQGREALEQANREWGLALSADEMDYLHDHAKRAGQDLTDAELMMFAQVNSEHCRHKIFNAEFTVDGVAQGDSLFRMIQASHQASPTGVLSAYKDNCAVIEGSPLASRWFPRPNRRWGMSEEAVAILMKVETHNHPTGISPHPGAGTGAGGEIRDEGATGRGGKPKAGLCGFSVANLRIPDFEQGWEAPLSRPGNVASALEIMLEAPIGAASYNNEFGRPNLAGYFRTYEQVGADQRNRGYHKPIMIAGGYGNIRHPHVEKLVVDVGAKLIVLGGPAMLIGLGGGAASSMATGTSSAELDFASVQRANPELERRCQEVIDACWALGDDNPILSIHDVGAGGISNALPELVDADGRGGRFRLRDVQSADPALSPMEIWCNESQERYVLAVSESALPTLESLCLRERCPMSVVGLATAEPQLIVEDADQSRVVDMPMPVLLGKPPKMKRSVERQACIEDAFELPKEMHTAAGLLEAASQVLRHPSVASKQFLITIGDRTVGGLSVRDQMVGPWQVPVADCAVTATGFESHNGEAMSMGERPVLALADAAASARMAVGEAITNIASASISELSRVRLSANWMAACGQGDEDARLFDAVRAIGTELCPALGICIPVGKDSLSMKSVWSDEQGEQIQTAPMSLIVSAFAPVNDVRRSLTPQLLADEQTSLLLIDLGNNKNRLGGSILAQVHSAVGANVPDLDQPEQLRAAFDLIQHWNQTGQILACHDRSDGGLFAAACEMAFAGHCGVSLEGLSGEALFAEELGWLVQVRDSDSDRLLDEARSQGLSVARVGRPRNDDRIVVELDGGLRMDQSRRNLFRTWFETSNRLTQLRDNPACADEEFDAAGQAGDTGLQVSLSFELAAPAIRKARPRVAILREQGVNGQAEMAWAFQAAGFDSIDVHMSEILSGQVSLGGFIGLVACGGFSYGDVLGAGQGWARSILFNERARDGFGQFFADPKRFALGVCNGCQMLAALSELIPGSEHWPVFKRNRSEQFEARWSQVEIIESNSLFFKDMAGSRLPIAVAHGEGRAEFVSESALGLLQSRGKVAMRYIDHRGEVASRYPANPNGSPGGITAICNADGRITAMMPHPERTVAGTTGSWWPNDVCGEFTPWLKLFSNARDWVGGN